MDRNTRRAMELIPEIRKRIETASGTRDKVATFHFSVLTHAVELRGVDPVEFCRAVGMEDTYKAEFHKMMKLAEFIKKMGMTIAPL